MSNDKLQATGYESFLDDRPIQRKDTQVAVTRALGVAGLTLLCGFVGGYGFGKTHAPAPEACVRAITLSEQALSASSDGIRAYIAMDTDGIRDAKNRIDSMAVEYQLAKAECRGK